MNNPCMSVNQFRNKNVSLTISFNPHHTYIHNYVGIDIGTMKIFEEKKKNQFAFIQTQGHEMKEFGFPLYSD